MNDRPTFETQLRLALSAYATDAPVEVDAAALADSIVRGRSIRRGRTRWRTSAGLGRSRSQRPRGWHLLAAAAILLVPIVAGTVLVGSHLVDRRTTDAPPAPGLTTAPIVSAPPVAEASIGPRHTPLRMGDTETVVRLLDGRFILLGGWDRNPQTVWDPSTGRYSTAGLLVEDRDRPIGVLLEDGRVLILGGNQVHDTPTESHATYSTAEIYDPTAKTFRTAGPMVGKGVGSAAVRLKDGRVLVLDGTSVDRPDAPDPYLTTAETYDPATDTFTATGPMSVGRGPAQMTVLADGRVLVLGGRQIETGNLDAVDLFDPATDRFESAGPLPPTGDHPVAGGTWWPEEPAPTVTSSDGTVLMTGRRCREESTATLEGQYPTTSAIFDPATRTFTSATAMPHCVGTATLLADGRVFLTAFWGTCCSLAEVYWSGVYDPATGSVTDSIVPPGGPYMTVLQFADGRIWMSAPGADPKVFDPHEAACCTPSAAPRGSGASAEPT